MLRGSTAPEIYPHGLNKSGTKQVLIKRGSPRIVEEYIQAANRLSGCVPPNTPIYSAEHSQPDMDQLKKLLEMYEGHERAKEGPFSSYTSTCGTSTAKFGNATSSDSTLTSKIPACWRLSEVNSICDRRDMHGIARLLKFRPFNDMFELRPHIVSQPSRHDVPHSSWNWKHFNSRRLDSNEIARAIAAESMSKFSGISFEDWVRHALGLTPGKIKHFERQYSELSCRIYYYLRRHMDEVGKYYKVVEILRVEDPFIRAAIENSCRCSEKKAYADLQLNFDGFVHPIHEVLNQPLPIEHVLQQLEVLCVRYKRQFLSPEIDWSRVLDTDTTFFNNIQREEVRAVVVELSKKDLHHFQGLTMHSMIAGKADKALTSLNVRWNNLCHDVQECMHVSGVEEKLSKLAEELYYYRNLYSSTAVLSGLRLGNSQSSILYKFNYLIDPGNNYEAYRRMVDSGPALHFLFPLIRDSRRGNTGSAMMAFEASKRYKVRKTRQGLYSGIWNWESLSIIKRLTAF